MRLEVFRVAHAALRTSAPRFLLPMLGLVVGIAAVITMIALGDGAQ